jgi:alanine racemase
MDLMALDVTDLPRDAVRVGALAELIGPTVTLAEVADRCGTIDYEILTSLGGRYERRYLP